jgi:3-methylcrotonyl-CoA carboxylase alpha subunit
VKLFVNGEEVEFSDEPVQIDRLSDRFVVKTTGGASTAVAIRSGDAVLVSYRGQQYKIERKRPRASVQGASASGEMRAPMPGQIVDVLLTEGTAVVKGDKILVLEAMKTQQAFTAPFDGTLTKVAVARGDQVVDGALLALVSPSDGGS